MKTQKAPEQRKELHQKVLATFETEMKNLSKPFQKILADDLVTAFENRMSVFLAVQQKTSRKRG